ncbi:hypothetical protein CPC16_008475 [Podila verticillata]|nr:hypothetical protein CPC16_008475 [Podila verticillata]
MPLHRGRKKSTPVRSPAQGDTSKAVVHADGYNLQNDPSHAVDMAMALDVAMLPSLSSYAPQQFQSGTSANSTLRGTTTCPVSVIIVVVVIFLSANSY